MRRRRVGGSIRLKQLPIQPQSEPEKWNSSSLHRPCLTDCIDCQCHSNVHCSSRPPPANIALNTAPACRRQHSIKAATHPTPIRTGKMERGGGAVLEARAPTPPPIFFYKEQERCAIVPSCSRGVIQISCLSGEIAIGGGIGPCFSGTCPITSPQFFAIQKKITLLP